VREPAAELVDLFADLRGAHSDLQIDRFILAKSGGGTAWGRYHQALRELHKRWRGLKQIEIERRRRDVDVREKEETIARLEGMAGEERGETRFDLERARIDLAELRMAEEEGERAQAETEREFKRFFAHAAALKAEIGDVDDERRAQLDHEFWLRQLTIEASLDMATHGRPSRGVLEVICALTKEDRVLVLQEACEAIALQDGHDAPGADGLELRTGVDGRSKLEGPDGD
jgi:hypothetical protein